MEYIIHVLILINIYYLLAISLNLLVGYTGLLSLAQAGFFGIGAYSYAILSVGFGVSFILSLCFGILVSFLFSFLITFISRHLRGDYFVLGTIALQFLIYSLAKNWSDNESPLGTFYNLTNGTLGIKKIPNPEIFGFNFSTISSIQPNESLAAYFLLSLIIVFLSVFVVKRLLLSPWGRLLRMIKTDELATMGLGKHIDKTKMQVIAISSCLSGLAGVLYSSYVGYIGPDFISFDISILILSMLMVGGTGNLKGPYLGAFILLVIPEVLSFIDFQSTMSGSIRLLIYGILLVFLMHYRPQGLIGSK